MKPTLAMTPLEPLQKQKSFKKTAVTAQPRKPVQNATPRFALGEVENSSRSSTTLRSVMQRVNPSMFVVPEESTHDMRKTPFGVVKISKKGGSEVKKEETIISEERVTMPAGTTSWGNGYGTRGLLPVRQRIFGGRIEVTRQGTVMVTKGQASILISSDGSQVTIVSHKRRSDNSDQIEDMCQAAIKWLARHRQKSTLAGFMLAAKEESPGSKSRGAEEYIAYCSVKGNGPLPNYQVRFAAVEEVDRGRANEKSVDEWNVEVQVDVQRHRNQMILHTKIRGINEQRGESWKQCFLPIKRVKHNSYEWGLDGTSLSSLVLQDLSRREQKVIIRSLHAAYSVDSVFGILIEESQ